MSPRFPSPVIDQMLTRSQITRVAPNRAQSDQLLTQAEAHLRSAQVLRDADTAGAFVLAYDAARKALTAILLNQGLKPRGEGAHALLAEGATGRGMAGVTSTLAAIHSERVQDGLPSGEHRRPASGGGSERVGHWIHV